MPVLGALLGLLFFIIMKLGIETLIVRVCSRVQTARNIAKGDTSEFVKALFRDDLPYLKR